MKCTPLPLQPQATNPISSPSPSLLSISSIPSRPSTPLPSSSSSHRPSSSRSTHLFLQTSHPSTAPPRPSVPSSLTTPPSSTARPISPSPSYSSPLSSPTDALHAPVPHLVLPHPAPGSAADRCTHSPSLTHGSMLWMSLRVDPVAFLARRSHCATAECRNVILSCVATTSTQKQFVRARERGEKRSRTIPRWRRGEGLPIKATD